MNHQRYPSPLHYFALSLILLLLSCNTQNTPNEKKGQSPNVIFILVDDMGWSDLACYGSSFHETPHIDQFASEGMRFTNAYSANPVCSPTRAAIMTGKYPTRVNITDWIPGQNPKGTPLLGPEDLNELPLSETTLGEAMKENGYPTFFAGKWHLGSEGFFPEQQGFDVNKGGHHKGSPPGGYYTPYKNPKLSDGPEGEYLTDRLTTESIQFIEDHKEKPFFLFLSFYTVHTPIQANKKHISKFQTKLASMTLPSPFQMPEHGGTTRLHQSNPDYASMVYALDENIGRLQQKLKETGLDENTIIILTSDNGGLSTLAKNRKAPTSVKPLRGGKGWCYEGGIRVPLIIKAPKVAQANTTCDVPVISHDFYPTILQLSGLPMKPEQHVDGLSLVPLLKGEKQLDRASLFWHFPHYHGSAWKPGAAIRKGDWKLIEFYEEQKTELYDLGKDLGEQNDLAASNPNIVKELKAELLDLQKATGAKFPVANVNYIAPSDN